MPPKSYHCYCASYACAGEVWQRRTIAKHVSVDRSRAEELLALAAGRPDGKRPRLPEALEKALEWGERCFERSNEVDDPAPSSSSSSMPMHADAIARAAQKHGFYTTAHGRAFSIDDASSSTVKRLPHRRPIVHTVVGDRGGCLPDGGGGGSGSHHLALMHHRRRIDFKESNSDGQGCVQYRRSKGDNRRRPAPNDVNCSGSEESEGTTEDDPSRTLDADNHSTHDVSPLIHRHSASDPFLQAGQSHIENPGPAQPQHVYKPPQAQPYTPPPPRPQHQHWAPPPPPPQVAGRISDAQLSVAQPHLSSVPSSYSSSYPLQVEVQYGPAPPLPRRQSSLPSASSWLLSLAAPSLPDSLLPKPLAAFRPAPKTSMLPGPAPAVWSGHRVGRNQAATGEQRKRKDSAFSLDCDRPYSGKRTRCDDADSDGKRHESPPAAPASTANSEASAVAGLQDAVSSRATGPCELRDSPSAMSSSSSIAEEDASTAPPSASSRRSSHSSSNSGTGSSRSSHRQSYRRSSVDEELHLPSVSDLLRLAPCGPSPQPFRDACASAPAGTLVFGEGDPALARTTAVAGLTHGELLANPLYRSLVECVQLVAQGRA